MKYVKSIGMDKLVANAQMLAQATRAAATALNLELFAPHSPGAAVTAIKSPTGMDSGVIVKDFRKRFGSVIANGQGSMQGQLFRVAHLGYFDFPDLFAVIAELEIILAANGVPGEVRNRRGGSSKRLLRSRPGQGNRHGINHPSC